MFLKVVRIFIVVGILFSYLPIAHMDGCSEQNHMDNNKISCGYLFHCPIISSIGFSELVAIPNIARLVLIMRLPLFEDLEYPIFHPPKAMAEHTQFASSILKGDGRIEVGTRVAYLQ